MYVTFDQLFERFRYPAGESHLRLRNVPKANRITIEAAAYNFDDLGQIRTADRVLTNNGITAEWFVPYFPFARHDRRIDTNDGLELQIALDLVADLNIVIADAHSDVAGQLPQFGQESVVALYRQAGIFNPGTVIVVPDAGAAKKAYDWAGMNPIVQCLKHRDQRTGKLSGFEVLADDIGGADCIIVDDICDGGGTFLGVAAELASVNAGLITLAVTHGLFTKGTGTLLTAFDRIVTFEQPGVAEPTEPEPRVVRLRFSDLYTKGTRR